MQGYLEENNQQELSSSSKGNVESTANAPVPSALPAMILDVPLTVHTNRNSDESVYLMIDDAVHAHNMECNFMESAKPNSSSEQHGFD
jgi:hypothetical protein